jgi:hypothetical protein
MPPGARHSCELSDPSSDSEPDLAQERHQSVSTAVADLAIRGLATLGEPVTVATDPTSGFPVSSLGREVTSDDVADALDDE